MTSFLNYFNISFAHHLKRLLVWFAAAWPGPAAAPAQRSGQRRTARRPLSAGRTTATAGSSQEPGGGISLTLTNCISGI